MYNRTTMVDNSRLFNLCGITIQLVCQDAAQAEKLEALWRQVFVLRDTAAQAPIPAPGVTLRLFDSSSHPQALSTGWTQAEEVFSIGHLRLSKTAHHFLLHCGSSFIELNLQRVQGEGSITGELWGLPLVEQREFFLIALMILFRQLNLFNLHADGVAYAGVGHLIVGKSGCGKSTLALTLIHQDWQYLCDDALVLCQPSAGSSRVEAQALRRGFACPPELIHLFDGRKAGAGGRDGNPLVSPLPPSPARGEKLLLDLHSLLPGQFTERLIPSVLLFPQIAHQSRTQLVPWNETRAVIALLEQSAGIMTGGEETVKKQSAVLAQLVHQARRFQVLLGTDVYDDPAAVSGQLLSIG